MATKKREIYARAAVQLRTHDRANDAEAECPGAMGLYLFLLLQARGEGTNGDVGVVAAHSSWGAPSAYRKKQAAALLKVGLVELRDGRYHVVRYDEHNDTADDIAGSKEAARLRMADLRAQRAAEREANKAARSPSVQRTETERSGDVPISSSISSSLSGSSSGRDPEPDRSPTPRVWGRGASAERALEVFADAVTSVTGEPFVVGPAPFLRDDICALMNKRGPKGVTMDVALAWLGDAVQEWAKATPDADERKPSRLTDWINAGKPDRRARGKRGAEITKQPFDENAPWMKIGDTGS